MEAEFGTTRAEASLPYTLNMIGFALGNFALGRALDRFGVTLSLILAALGIAAGLGLAIASGSIAMLSAAQLLIGFASAVGFGPLIADGVRKLIQALRKEPEEDQEVQEA